MSYYTRALRRQRLAMNIANVVTALIVVAVVAVAGAPTWGWLGLGLVTYLLLANK